MLQRYKRCISRREGNHKGGRPHDDWAVVWHVLAIDYLESGEESPHSPVGEPPYDPMGDVGFSHVGDGAGQGELSELGGPCTPISQRHAT